LRHGEQLRLDTPLQKRVRRLLGREPFRATPLGPDLRDGRLDASLRDEVKESDENLTAARDGADVREFLEQNTMEPDRSFLAADADLDDATTAADRLEGARGRVHPGEVDDRPRSRSANEVNDEAHLRTPCSRARSKTSARIPAP